MENSWQHNHAQSSGWGLYLKGLFLLALFSSLYSFFKLPGLFSPLTQSPQDEDSFNNPLLTEITAAEDPSLAVSNQLRHQSVQSSLSYTWEAIKKTSQTAFKKQPNHHFRSLGNGGEIQVNTYINDDQVFSDIAQLKNGDVVITWTSNGQDGQYEGIYAQRYTRNGVLLGDEFQVNTFTSGSQFNSRVAALENGNFVIVWSSTAGLGFLKGQLFNGQGNFLGNEFQVGSDYAGNNLDVVGLKYGGFVVTWQVGGGVDGDNYGIFARQFDSAANPQGNDFQVNSYTTFIQWEPCITGLNDGGFVIAWSSADQDGSGQGIYGQRYDSSGNLVGNEFQANNITYFDQDIPDIAGLNNGGFVITWQDTARGDVAARLFNSAGDPVGEEILLNTVTLYTQKHSSIASLADGGFIAAWLSEPESFAAIGQQFSAAATKVGNEFQVSQTSAPDSTPVTTSSLKITGLDNGGYALTWWGNTDGDGFGIFARFYAGNIPVNDYPINFLLNGTTPKLAALPENNEFVLSYSAADQDGSGVFLTGFTENGVQIGNSTQVNNNTVGTQAKQQLAVLPNGNLMVAWHSSDAALGSSWSIAGRRFNNSLYALDNEFRINSHDPNEQVDPAITALTNQYIVVWESNNQDGDGFGIYAQRYGTDGSALGSEFGIPVTTGDQYNPAITSLANDNFVVAWQNANDISAQIFDNAGSTVGSYFNVTQNATYLHLDIHMAPVADDFVVTWATANNFDGDNYGVYARRYNNTGWPLTDSFQVHTFTQGTQRKPQVLGFNNGDYFIVWSSNGQESEYNTYGRYFSGDFPQTGELRISNSTGLTSGVNSRPTIALLGNDRVYAAWEATDGIYGRYVNMPPVLRNNSLTITGGQTVMFTSENLAATDLDTHSDALYFAIEDVANGFFDEVSNPGVPITNFYQKKISDTQIRFVSTSLTQIPSYNVSVSDGLLNTTLPLTVNFTAVPNDPPTLVNNSFNITEGDSFLLNAAMLAANDTDNNDALLLFTISGLQFGQFDYTSNPSVAISQFYQQNITDNLVRFTHDGGESAPAFNIQVSDGLDTVGSVPAMIMFTPVNDIPVLVNNSFNIDEGATLILSSSELSAQDEDSSESDLLFTVSSILHGEFDFTTNPGVAVTQFRQQNITDALVRFTHDGSQLAPGFMISISDGINSTLPVTASINFNSTNDLPLLTANSLTIAEGQSVQLNSSHLAATDLETADSQLMFIPSDIQHGYFHDMLNITLPQFTQQNITEGAIYFTHDGSEIMPAYAMQVNDGVGMTSIVPASITFIPVNDPPEIVVNALTIEEGNKRVLSNTELDATDIDNTVNELTWQILNVQRGQFEQVSNPGISITAFSQAQINANAIQFVHDGSEAAPGALLRVTDGQTTTSPSSTVFNFMPINDPPLLTANRLTITKGSSVVLTTNDLAAIDPDDPNNALLFFLSNIQRGGFREVDNPTLAITQFSQQQIIDQNIEFVHDDSDFPPSYSVVVSDGKNTTIPSSPIITFRPPSTEKSGNDLLGPIAGGAGGLVALFSIIGLGMRYRHEKRRARDARQNNPLAERLNQRLKLKLRSFEADRGNEFKRMVDTLKTELNTKHSIDVGKMTREELDQCADWISDYVKQHINLKTHCCGFWKSFDNISSLQSRLGDIADHVNQQKQHVYVQMSVV